MKLSIMEVATALDVPEATVRRWVRQGKLPVTIDDGRYVLDRRKLRLWARARRMVLHAPPPSSPAGPVSRPSLGVALHAGGAFFDVEALDVASAIEAAVARAPIPDGTQRADVLARVLERESLASTGIGHGAAIPHPRSPVGTGKFEPRVTACFLHAPVDFRSMDGVPVFVVFLMLSPTIAVHLELLAELSFHLHDVSFREALGKCSSGDDLFGRFDGAGSQASN